MPRCTIVIPVYNSASTVERSILSALGQTETNVEIIIVDDGSKDASLMLIENCALLDKRITVLRNGENLGKAASMNKACRIASGDWIAVLDADDAYFPNRIASLIAVAEAEMADIAADNQLVYDPFERKHLGLLYEIDSKHFDLDLRRFLRSVTRRIDFGTLKPIVRRPFLERTGVAYNESARFSQDFYFLLELLLSGGRAIVTSDAQYEYTLPFSATRRQWTLTGAGPWRHDFALALRINESYLADARVKRDHYAFEMLSRKSEIIRKNIRWNVLKKKALEEGMARALIYAAANRDVFWLILERTLRRRFSG